MGGGGLFKLAVYFKQADTMLPFLDIPLKRLLAASMQRKGDREGTGLGCQRRRGRRWRG